MNIEELRDYCNSKKYVTEGFPFGGDTLVFKVMNKMFALTGIDGNPPSVNLKCEPEKAIALREEYSCVLPGYHMNKHHWNTVILDDSVPDSLVKEWIDDSYNLIVGSLPKRLRMEMD